MCSSDLLEMIDRKAAEQIGHFVGLSVCAHQYSNILAGVFCEPFTAYIGRDIRQEIATGIIENHVAGIGGILHSLRQEFSIYPQPIHSKGIAHGDKVARRTVTTVQTEDIAPAIMLEHVESPATGTDKTKYRLLLIAEIYESAPVTHRYRIDYGKLERSHVLQGE